MGERERESMVNLYWYIKYWIFSIPLWQRLVSVCAQLYFWDYIVCMSRTVRIFVFKKNLFFISKSNISVVKLTHTTNSLFFVFVFQCIHLYISMLFHCCSIICTHKSIYEKENAHTHMSLTEHRINGSLYAWLHSARLP